MNLFGSWARPPPPATVPTDTIIPFHYYDDSKHTRELCFDFTFRFDDELDPERLRASLSRLLEIGDWRKLGARIRRNAKGGLEYHVPQYFDSKRPAFAYSVDTFRYTEVDEHPQASRLASPHELDAVAQPVAFAVPSYKSTPEFKAFIRAPNFPDRLDDWLCSDSPQLGVRIIVFQDATLVTLSFLHSLTDMMGLKDIMDAWTAVLNGQEDRVKPFAGFSDDPLSGLSKAEAAITPKYIFSDLLLQGWNWILFGARYFLTVDLLWRHREEERIVFLPSKHLQRMREHALEDLAMQQVKGHSLDQKPFVSEGDVLFAWWSRVVLRAEAPSPTRLVNMRNTCCCRSLLTELGLIPTGPNALVTNAVFGTLTFLSAGDILSKSLSATASAIRTSLVEQRKAEQLQALDAIRRDMLDNARHPALFGHPSMLMIMISNWEKAKLFEVDFSEAVVRRGLPVVLRKNPLGRPSSLQGTGTRSYATRNTGAVIGKDAGGNYWLTYNLRKGCWSAVERQLQSMGRGVGASGSD